MSQGCQDTQEDMGPRDPWGSLVLPGFWERKEDGVHLVKQELGVREVLMVPEGGEEHEDQQESQETRAPLDTKAHQDPLETRDPKDHREGTARQDLRDLMER